MVCDPGGAVPQDLSGEAPVAAQARGGWCLLEEIGRKGSLKDWQFRQVVDALEALFCRFVVAPWAGQFDWGYWKDSCRSLATIARDGPLPRASGRHDRQEPA
ncbi:MAG: hypothetical protein ACREBC_35765, partial [Pyrinomonadaceae bacterium]